MKAIWAAAAAVVGLCAQAEGATFVFNPTSIGPTTNPFYSLDTPRFTIAISDAAVQSGSFTYDFRYVYPMMVGTPAAFTASGDVGAFQNFTANGVSFNSGQGPMGTASDFFSVNLQFTPSGQIQTGRLDYASDALGLSLAGTAQSFSGSFVVGNSFPDTVTGTLVPAASVVPEPLSASLLGLEVGVVVARRRQAVVAMSNAE